MIGFAMTGSFCTHKVALEQLNALLAQGEEVLPIVSEAVKSTDTRFGRAADLMAHLRQVCGREVITSVVDAEPLGPKTPLEAMIICPCTGNTAAKISLGITDGAVTMAAKAHLRADRPLLLALASNDALSGNFASIARLSEKKNVFFVPMSQDAPKSKPHSLVARFEYLLPAFKAAREGRQLQPLLMCPKEEA